GSAEAGHECHTPRADRHACQERRHLSRLSCADLASQEGEPLAHRCGVIVDDVEDPGVARLERGQDGGCRCADRASPATSYPAFCSTGSSWHPMTPLDPATSTRMIPPRFRSCCLRRGPLQPARIACTPDRINPTAGAELRHDR